MFVRKNVLPEIRDSTPKRLLISIPNWVGDVVMATPALRAIRSTFASTRIVYLLRPYVADVLAGSALGDANLFWSAGGSPLRVVSLANKIRAERFDAAILLTNSFKSALVVSLAGVPRRIGYARDRRSWLLTDRLIPARDDDGRFIPIPAIDYYNDLARRLGCNPDRRMTLSTTPDDESAIDRRLGSTDSVRPLVVLNPGANYGSAKCWPAEKYARLADELTLRYGARVVASLGPKERHIADAMMATTRQPIEVFMDPPLGLGPLKALIRRSQLLITNDTGPRHFAPAFGVPVITIFGSSDPAWTVTYFEQERNIMLDLDCQPCMARTCPLGHHNCMKLLEPDMVLAAADEILAGWRRGGSVAPLQQVVAR
ncbi:MAG TPA: lipopolysaccharide heptosyltransferase II [Phycisphaerae bacterium]|nr:lipopolysaccharide heptosyltransferase II [Phycisphaerae bacterium]